MTRAALVVLLVLLCLVLAALALGGLGAGAAALVSGGAARRGPDPARSPHVVVDTLNLTHWWRRRPGAAPPEGPLSTEEIVAAVDATAAELKRRHPGRVMYVVKDRESQLNDAEIRRVYDAAAKRNRIYLYAVERYADPPASGVPDAALAEHSARGRDDFFIALLAARWKCAVLTEDRLRDFPRFRATIRPFHVYEYAFWRALPDRVFVRPEAAAHARLRKPRAVRYAEYFGDSPT